MDLFINVFGRCVRMCVCINRNDEMTKIGEKKIEIEEKTREEEKRRASSGGLFFVRAKGDHFSHALSYLYTAQAFEFLTEDISQLTFHLNKKQKQIFVYIRFKSHQVLNESSADSYQLVEVYTVLFNYRALSNAVGRICRCMHPLCRWL